MRPPERLAWPMFGAVASTAPPPAISPSAASAAVRAGAAVRAEGRHVEPAQALGRVRAETPASVSASSSSKVRSATTGSEETERTASIAVTSWSRSTKVSTVNRSTPRPSRSFACSAKTSRVVGAALGQRPDRACDEDVLPRDLARVARALDARADDRLELVLEVEPGQLAPVRAERVRLDQLGPGPDEAQVRRDDALGRADVRLLGAAQARHGAREQRAHAAVADDHGPARQALEEPAHSAQAIRPEVNHRSQPSSGDGSNRPHPRYWVTPRAGPDAAGAPLGNS